MNTTAPTITSLIKIHKAGKPITPVVNWRNAHAFKLAKALTKKPQATCTSTIFPQHPKNHRLDVQIKKRPSITAPCLSIP
jgi:hypothetical protein